MSRLLYTFIYVLLLPLILLRLLWRSRLAPAYRKRWAERFGWFAVPAFDCNKPVIWLHAVSVGEALAAVPLVKKLQADHADWQWVITTTTPTGSERVRAIFTDKIFNIYAPYDVPAFISRFLKHTKPDLCIIMETELWPNMLAACRARNIPSVIVNARLSEKSARGYRKLVPLTRNMMKDLTLIAAQQQNDGERFVQLGLPREKLVVTGSIKFDLDIDQVVRDKAKVLRAQWSMSGTRKVWLAASTHAGEDDIILAAFSLLKKQFPALLLVLVPRHPERFSGVALLCQQAGWNVVRRSDNRVVTAHTDIVLGDTMGELLSFYGAADIAFVGGSLVPVGGHNLIEPAAWACAVISGPHLFNFSEVERLLHDNHALVIASSSEEMAAVVNHYLCDDNARLQAGQRAWQVAENNRGALARVVNVLESCVSLAKF